MICDRPDLTLQAVLADQLRRIRHASHVHKLSRERQLPNGELNCYFFLTLAGASVPS